MDFLVFMSIYLLVFAVVVILYYYADSAVLRNGVLKWMKWLWEALLSLIPSFIKNIISGVINHVFYQRSSVLKFVYGSLVVAGHIVLVVDILPIVYSLDATGDFVILPLVLAFINVLFFSQTSVSDPGEITPVSQKYFSPAYKYDCFLYKEGMECRTCLTPKLPRSKHCSICDRCIYRFDHHCIWTNNCIGGLNHVYFILFLLSIVTMCVNGVFICWRTLELVVNHFNMLETVYLDKAGNVQRITLLVLFQHLFLKFPRIVFTMVSLAFVTLMIGGFSLYHIYLVVRNQTTNERYKIDAVLQERQKSMTDSRSKAPGIKHNFKANFYDAGIVHNIYEVLLPKTYVKEMMKKT